MLYSSHFTALAAKPVSKCSTKINQGTQNIMIWLIFTYSSYHILHSWTSDLKLNWIFHTTTWNQMYYGNLCSWQKEIIIILYVSHYNYILSCILNASCRCIHDCVLTVVIQFPQGHWYYRLRASYWYVHDENESVWMPSCDLGMMKTFTKVVYLKSYVVHVKGELWIGEHTKSQGSIQ